ncbi:MAG: exonuclease domain-containing protein [Marinobacterium sp.]|nr:exonuclease domain-containing protein [Marinobacterium sp.]
MSLHPSSLPDFSTPVNTNHCLHTLIFIDLETTGAVPHRDRITEIGLVWYDQETGWQQASSLVNPGRPIPASISRLTGITDAMVNDAPTFKQLMPALLKLIRGRILVAHNVRFDYGFLSRELARCNQALGQRHLCTVRLSRQLEPEQDKHGLAVLAHRWQLTLNNHHRALADAQALAQLWCRWLQHFDTEHFNQLVKQCIREVHLPPHMQLTDLIALPDGPGVYLFYGEPREGESNLLYIGKSIDLRGRVFSHFSEALHNSKEARMVQQTRRIESISCAGDLSAQLLEARLIKERHPLYNRQLRKKRKIFSWKLEADAEGYLHPELYPFDEIPLSEIGQCYGQFQKPADARKALEGLSKKYKLCKYRTGLEKHRTPCFGYQLKQCYGACTGEESSESYNERLRTAFSPMEIAWWPFDGALCLYEDNTFNTFSCYHVIYQWRYLGSCSLLNQATTLLDNEEQIPFDLDSSRILQRQLRHYPKQKSTVLPIVKRRI